ncbi:hypothetical protein HDU92_001457 [Lobulomyces angularis]|nr:hypothetical protein HDU92_001457 [Lobulomyces angularis]
MPVLKIELSVNNIRFRTSVSSWSELMRIINEKMNQVQELANIKNIKIKLLDKDSYELDSSSFHSLKENDEVIVMIEGDGIYIMS